MLAPRMPRRLYLALITLAFLSFAPSTFAQGFGTIVGTVTDPAGAVVPGAKVTVTNEGTEQSRDVVSNDQGYFVVPSVQPASYSLTVNSSGFASFTQVHLRVLADQSLTANVSLTLQQSSEKVTVEATPVQVDTSTSTLNQVVEQKRIVDLPLNGRNAASLALLVPGAIQAPPDNSDQGVYKTFPTAVTVSANGSRANQTSFNLDGSNNNDPYTNVNQPFPFPDALQEFSVQTSDYGARYGGNAGAVVNIITKSGSNDLHGDAFEFNRNAVFNARNYFAGNRDQLKRNQFGGTIGGPIVIPRLYDGRNKTFFFFGYQRTNLSNIQNGQSAFVPTPAELGGDFSALLNPNSPNNPFGRSVPITDPSTGQPFSGNIIPTSRFDPAALAFTRYLPVSAAAGNGKVYYSTPLGQNFNEYIGRVDHSFSEKDRLTARYFFDRFDNQAFNTPNNYLSLVSSSLIVSQNALLQETHILKPNLLNDFRLAYSRETSDAGPPPNTAGFGNIGVNIYQPPGPTNIDSLQVSGYFSVSSFPQLFLARNTLTPSDDVSWTLGRHTLTFGGSYTRGALALRDAYLAHGQFSFTSDITNNALASFLLGKIRTFQQGAGEYKDNINNTFGLYLQDDYHVSKRLTLNLGVRYEPFIPWQETRGRIEQFRISNYQADIVSQQFPNAPPGLLFPGDPGMPQYGVNGAYKNFSPRAGFAWDVAGNGKTSVRGGFGSFYESQQIGIINNRFVDVSPFSPQVSVAYPAGPFSNPYAGSVDPFPAVLPPPKNATFPTPVLAVTYDPANNSQMKPPVTYNYNFTVEHQFLGGWLGRIAYVGSESRHLTETIELNPAVYTPGSTAGTDARRLFQPFGSIGQSSQDINSNYNALQATAQKRMSNGLTVLANYTYSKSLDDVPNGQGNAGIASQSDSPIPWYLPGRHQFDYGRSDFDHEQNFVLSYTWQTPALSRINLLVREILGSWETTGILSVRSGGPVTVLAGQDRSQTGIQQDRGVLLNSNVFGSGACKNTAPCVDYLNTTAFGIPALGTYGNIGKGSFSGPGFLNWDVGLLKNFPLKSERYILQFHAEFFNVLNRANFGNPNASVQAAGFGTITGTSGDPRIGQLALKVLF